MTSQVAVVVLNYQRHLDTINCVKALLKSDLPKGSEIICVDNSPGTQSAAAIKKEVPKSLELVGLEDKATAFPHEMSGGEKQRVAIARAMVHKPVLLLADEPTGNLDSINAWEILQLLLKINKTGTTVILATHAKDLVNSIKKRVITIEKGEITNDQEKGKYLL